MFYTLEACYCQKAEFEQWASTTGHLFRRGVGLASILVMTPSSHADGSADLPPPLSPEHFPTIRSSQVNHDTMVSLSHRIYNNQKHFVKINLQSMLLRYQSASSVPNPNGSRTISRTSYAFYTENLQAW